MEDFFLNTVGTWALGLVAAHPIGAGFIMICGVLRLTVKPVMTIAQSVAKLTPYDSDDLWLKDAEQSKGYKLLTYVLDWTASVKLPEKPKGEAFSLKPNP